MARAADFGVSVPYIAGSAVKQPPNRQLCEATVQVSVPYIAGSAVKPRETELREDRPDSFSPLHRGERSEAGKAKSLRVVDLPVSVPYIAGSAVKRGQSLGPLAARERFQSPTSRGAQ